MVWQRSASKKEWKKDRNFGLKPELIFVLIYEYTPYEKYYQGKIQKKGKIKREEGPGPRRGPVTGQIRAAADLSNALEAGRKGKPTTIPRPLFTEL